MLYKLFVVVLSMLFGYDSMSTFDFPLSFVFMVVSFTMNYHISHIASSNSSSAITKDKSFINFYLRIFQFHVSPLASKYSKVFRDI
jgi:hypothetical protein